MLRSSGYVSLCFRGKVWIYSFCSVNPYHRSRFSAHEPSYSQAIHPFKLASERNAEFTFASPNVHSPDIPHLICSLVSTRDVCLALGESAVNLCLDIFMSNWILLGIRGFAQRCVHQVSLSFLTSDSPLYLSRLALFRVIVRGHRAGDATMVPLS